MTDIQEAQDKRAELLQLRHMIDTALDSNNDALKEDVIETVTRETIEGFYTEESRHKRRGVLSSTKKTVTRRERRMQEISDLLVQGKRLSEMAEITGLTEDFIGRYLSAIRKTWAASVLVDYDTKKAQELAKIDFLERQQWETIAQVSQDAQENGAYTDIDHRRVSKAQDNIMWCIARRIKLFGLDAPLEINWRVEAARYGIDPNKLYHQMVDSFANQLMDENALLVIEPPDDDIPEDMTIDDMEDDQ